MEYELLKKLKIIELVEIVLDYKYMFEHKTKFKKCLDQILTFDKKVKYYNSYGINNWQIVTNYEYYIRFPVLKYKDIQIIYIKKNDYLICTIADYKIFTSVEFTNFHKYFYYGLYTLSSLTLVSFLYQLII